MGVFYCFSAFSIVFLVQFDNQKISVFHAMHISVPLCPLVNGSTYSSITLSFVISMSGMSRFQTFAVLMVLLSVLSSGKSMSFDFTNFSSILLSSVKEKVVCGVFQLPASPLFQLSKTVSENIDISAKLSEIASLTSLCT